jgi:hypothetical protein
MGISFTEAFAKYGAKLSNPQWSFSAITEDGPFVMSCWQHLIQTPEKGVMRYSDHLSRRKSQDTPGQIEFIMHLRRAYLEKLPVRLIIVSTQHRDKVDAGEEASQIPKEFDVRENYVGKVVSFDGDAYVIDFKKFATD